MLELLGQLGETSCIHVVMDRINSGESEAVQLAALSALPSFPQADIRGLLSAYPLLSAPVKAKARDVLLSRKNWALALLTDVDTGKFAAQQLPLDQLQKVALLGNPDLDSLVRKH